MTQNSEVFKKEEMDRRRELAMTHFLEGYNCSQSVCLAFQDKVGLDPTTLSRLSSSFGGGMGRLREVCGAVSGMSIIAGLLYGYAGPETAGPKNEHYARIQALAHKYEDENGSIVCRELLGLDKKHDIPIAEARTKEYYKKRPCKELVGQAAAILAEMIFDIEKPITE